MKTFKKIDIKGILWNFQDGVFTAEEAEKHISEIFFAAFREYVEEVIGEDEDEYEITRNGRKLHRLDKYERNRFRKEQRKRLSFLSGLSEEKE